MRRRQNEFIQEKKDYEFERKLFYGVLIASTITSILLVGGGAATWGWYVASLRRWGLTYRSDNNNNGHSLSDYSQSDVIRTDDGYYDPTSWDNTNDNRGADHNGGYIESNPDDRTFPEWESNPSLPGGEIQVVDDTELNDISRILWDHDIMRLRKDQFKLNTPVWMNTSSRIDNSRELPKLFESLMVSVEQTKSARAFVNLLDNYQAPVGNEESYTSSQDHEVEAFLDAALETDVMKQLHTFLADRGLASHNSALFKEFLKKIWFEVYPSRRNSDVRDSSGFEQVFVGTIRGRRVQSFHSWIQFYLEEEKEQAKYLGYNFYSRRNPYVINIRMTWRKSKRADMAFFVATSPEYDMAIYTLCFLVRKSQECIVDVNGSKVPILVHDVEHKLDLQIEKAMIDL